MNVLSTTVEYKGYPLKVENGRVFVRAFGTTIYNHSMHWSWAEVSKENMSNDLKNFLNKNNLL